MKSENQIRGKKARASGQRFELKVRKDLEDKGWIVAKWTNNVRLDEEYCGLVKVRNKFLGPGKPMMLGAGFPDFIAYVIIKKTDFVPEVIGVESKSNGILDKEEKEKCKWLLDNNIFSKILIARKGEKRGSVEYKEFTLSQTNTNKEVKG